MEMLWTIVGGLFGVAIGIVGGLWVGRRLRDSRYVWYWVANAAALMIGVAGNTLGLLYSYWWLVIGSLAFAGGSLTGLKYGLGRSIGLWRVHDDFVGNDDLPKE